MVMNALRFSTLVLFAAAMLLFWGASQSVAEEKDDHLMKLADGKLELTAAKSWKRVEPKVRIIAYEYSVEPSEGDEDAGRVTVMGAGGGIEANLARWLRQFTQPDGADTADRAKIEKKTIAGQEVHLVDVSGTYRNPFGNKGPQPKYRMLSAIVATKKRGSYFLKFIGPQRTVADNEKAFAETIGSLKVR